MVMVLGGFSIGKGGGCCRKVDEVSESDWELEVGDVGNRIRFGD